MGTVLPLGWAGGATLGGGASGRVLAPSAHARAATVWAAALTAPCTTIATYVSGAPLRHESQACSAELGGTNSGGSSRSRSGPG